MNYVMLSISHNSWISEIPPSEIPPQERTLILYLLKTLKIQKSINEM